MIEIPVLDYSAVLDAVSARDAIDCTRDAFLAHHHGAWTMPAKVYLDSPPYGDFRAMPALGGGLALLKWVTSFPGNRARGLPVVSGIVCLSDAETGVPQMLLDARAVTALRTGAVAAVAAEALARKSAHTVGIVGCGVHGQWAARCLVAAGFTEGVCADIDVELARGLATETGWVAGRTEAALACDIVCCVTPGAAPVVQRETLRPGQHLNMLGADGPGKAEAAVDAVLACRLFCDEWEQAAHGGELCTAVGEGRVTSADVTELGAVLAGERPGRQADDEVTMFDSTGLAIQDLGIAHAAWRAFQAGAVEVQTVKL